MWLATVAGALRPTWAAISLIVGGKLRSRWQVTMYSRILRRIGVSTSAIIPPSRTVVRMLGQNACSGKHLFVFFSDDARQLGLPRRRDDREGNADRGMLERRD